MIKHMTEPVDIVGLCELDDYLMFQSEDGVIYKGHIKFVTATNGPDEIMNAIDELMTMKRDALKERIR
jgi:hypothetical protein